MSGIGGGIALSQCAAEFNKIQARGQRITHMVSNEVRDDFEERMAQVQK